MENVIIYVIIAVIVIVNIIRTYRKEANKNKERTFSPLPRSVISSLPAPFSRPQQIEEPVRSSGYQSIPQTKPTEYNPANEGVSAIQERINNQSKSDFKGEESSMKTEDSNKDSFDLKLDTAEDFKRAFIHTLIFEKKY